MLDNSTYHSPVWPGFQMDFPSIALLTDFGEHDGFVGVMKGVMLHLLEQPVPMVDISHQIEPQNIRQAMWVLESAYAYFPEKTVFLCVIDPGVGNREQACLLAFWPERQQVFIAPDNGLLTPIYEAAGPDLHIRDIRLSTLFQEDSLSLKGRSNTFYGRDVYAPTAALAVNACLNNQLIQFLKQFEPLSSPPVNLQRQKPQQHVGGTVSYTGEIVAVDRFGNLITNIPHTWIQDHHLIYQIKLNNQGSYTCLYQLSYAPDLQFKLSSDDLLLLPSSNRTLELAIFMGSAQSLLSAKSGDFIYLSPIT